MRFLAVMAAACLAAACAVLDTATEARAGAWTLAEGSGQVIMTTGRRIAPAGAFASGTPDEDANVAQIFVEYGLAERWTVGATIYAEISTTDTREVEIRAGGHVRHRVWQGADGDVVSVQAGASLPVERWIVGESLADALDDTVPEIDLRALYGRGWQWSLGNSFVSVETGLRWRGGDEADELRIDATAGHEAWKGILAMIGVYSSVPVIGAGDGDDDASLKLAPSVAWTMWPRLGPNDKKPRGELNPATLQFGIVWDALNPGDGLGVQISVWHSF